MSKKHSHWADDLSDDRAEFMMFKAQQKRDIKGRVHMGNSQQSMLFDLDFDNISRIGASHFKGSTTPSKTDFLNKQPAFDSDRN